MDTNKTYYLKYNGHYYKVYYQDNYWGSGWKVGYGSDLEDYDGDIYTYSTRLDALKSAATQFITDTATTSPTSNVGISVFSSKGYGNHGDNKPLAAVDTNKDTLISFINDLSANGGTDPAVGLQDAYNKLKAAADNGDTLPKYVILFTDGEPTGGGSTWDPEAQTDAEAKAKKLKDMGVKVYTIGFALDDKTETFLAGGEYDGTTYPGIASPGCAMVADDASKLAEIFKTIQSTITQNCDINDAIVVDVIDPRFVILDDAGNQITEKYLEEKNAASVTLKNGGTVYYENGKQYIKWTEQTIKHKEGNTQGWHKKISVQAKDDYIGGNDVPTNISPDSKIITSYGELTLPQPKVNVKAELTLKDKEITIYKGDSVPSAETVLGEMVDKYTDNVNKYSVSKKQFDAKWYTADALKDNKENFNDNTATTSDVVGTAVINDTTYYLKVTYDAGKPSAESNKNTTLKVGDKDKVHSAGDDKTHKVEAVKKATDPTLERTYGIYQIQVISGRIQIVKRLETTAKKDQTFTFVVKNAEDDNEMAREVARVLVTVKANEKEATVTDQAALATLTNLSRGIYTVEEEEQTGYMLDSAVSDDTTNCQNSTDNAKVTFVLGNSSVSPNENVIKNYTYNSGDGGTRGKAIFTNEPVYSDWQIIKVSSSSHDVRLAGAIFADCQGSCQ
ncbi:vWA domain-containing protein, partial [Coprococcus sp. CLA-AA-H190]